MTKLPAVKTSQLLPFSAKVVPLSAIANSLTNPRKHFDQAKLEELAASIAANGLLQPPGVRPQRAAGQVVPNEYVLVWGERRTKAARLAGLREIEVRIYDVDDQKAAELQLVENDEREDLTPLERAAGYKELQKKHGLSVEQIAERVQKSRSAVYEAISLLGLSSEAKRMLEEEEISPTIATMIAGLSPETHEAALEFALEGIDGKPCSSRVFREWIHEEFMLDLADAPFDIKDASLVPKAGACINCPKRTGANGGQMDLLAPKGRKSPDLCKDKPCFNGKVTAHRAQVLAKAERDGKPLLSAGESKKALSKAETTEYVRVDQWSKALAKTKLEPVLAVAPDGELVEVARKKDVRAALKEAGSALANSSALRVETGAPSPAENKEAREKEEAAAELRAKVASSAKRLVVAYIEKNGFETPFLRLAARTLMSGWGGAKVYEGRGFPSKYDERGSDFDKRFGKAKPNVLEGVLFEALFDSDHDYHQPPAKYSPLLIAAAEVIGIDLKKLEKEVADTEKLKASAEAQAGSDRLTAMLKDPHGKKAAESAPAVKKPAKKSTGGGANARSPR